MLPPSRRPGSFPPLPRDLARDRGVKKRQIVHVPILQTLDDLPNRVDRELAANLQHERHADQVVYLLLGCLPPDGLGVTDEHPSDITAKAEKRRLKLLGLATLVVKSADDLCRPRPSWQPSSRV